MLIPTNEIPQADDLDLVVRATEAVAHGARTDRDIAEAIGGYDPRQGRYYRRAGEIVGFIRNLPRENRSLLTPTGQEFLQSAENRRREILAAAVLGSRLIQRVIPFLETSRPQGVSRGEFRRFIDTVTVSTTPAMVNRRLSTIIAWLIKIGILDLRDGRYVLSGLPRGVELLDYAATDEPLLPQSYEFTEYQAVARRVQREIRDIRVLIDAAARERANDSHQMLTDLVANKIRTAGGIPKRNRLIDLSTRLANNDFLFEMKSTTNDNVHAQVRTAISQLYEYRYIQKIPNAKLVVVIENPPPRDVEWMVDYVVKDRGLLIAWDGDRRTLRYPEPLRDALEFLD